MPPLNLPTPRLFPMKTTLFLVALLSAGVARGEDASFFENKIRPLLAEHCYECHSADKKQKGNLLLDTREATLRGGDTGPALVPGDPAKSLLLKAVRWSDKDLQMPPKKQLSAEQITALEAWIKSGAPDPRDGSRPLTKIEQHLEDAKKHWAFQPVVDPKPTSLDALIGLKNTTPADKRTLIRRAYLDLLGVPPSYEEVQAFYADSAPNAFSKLVDRLLADTRYGERWGRHWLDVARYADNMGGNGGRDDPYPNSHTYRDYVIDAFNADKPYDRFLMEQIAADQLESAKDTRTLAALGFLGVGRRKDLRVDDDVYDDIIDVLGRGVLGLSIGCARCHDHKLEPVTTKDYYGLYAVLRSSKEPEVLPSLPQADTDQTREFAAKNRAARAEYIRVIAFEADRSLGALLCRIGDYLLAAKDAGLQTIYQGKTVKAEFLDPRRLHTAPHNRLVLAWEKWVKKHPEVFTPWLELSALEDADFASKARPLCEGFGKNADKTLHASVARAFAKAAPKNLREVADIYNTLYANQIDALWSEKWREPLRAACTPAPEELDLPLKEVEIRAIDRVVAVQLGNALPEPEDQSLRAVFLEDTSPFRFSGKDFIASGLYGTRDVADGLRRNAAKAVTDLNNHQGAPPRAMTWVDADKMYEGKVFVRGNPNSPGPEAPRQFLTVLKPVSPEPFPKDKSGRLELARAVASRQNPLTARVIVNRVWAWHFGEPLVGTPSDFGFRGDSPANQPLLDHLAAWFMENGWSFKKLHKHLLLTAAYQRADFPMRPLELEPFRDALLSVTGRLQTAPGGRGDKITESARRTVYAIVDRRTLPALHRSFDFPDPNFSAAKRDRTALSPRALILLNSPLLTESARKLAADLSAVAPDESVRLRDLYRRVLQRDPSAAEVRMAHDYLAAYPADDLVHPEASDWQYGFGGVDPASKQVQNFTPLTNFSGQALRGAGATSGVVLDALGGDPGSGSNQSTIRRWTAPLAGEVNITAELVHMDEKSDGVVARIVSDRSGVLGEWSAQKQAVCTDLVKVRVAKGEKLDFLVSSVAGKDAAAYKWSPSILMPGAEMAAMPGMARRWDARMDFANPSAPPKPLTAWEELCQTLLLSPEFSALE